MFALSNFICVVGHAQNAAVGNPFLKDDVDVAISDAVLPGAVSDGVLLCFRAHEVRREAVVNCREQLQLANVKILGGVFNGYRPTHGHYYRRRYNYASAYVEETGKAEADSAA